MTMANGERTYQLKALTDVWTGDVNGKPDRFITSGLLGFIRWWFEVLVRGTRRTTAPSRARQPGAKGSGLRSAVYVGGLLEGASALGLPDAGGLVRSS